MGLAIFFVSDVHPLHYNIWFFILILFLAVIMADEINEMQQEVSRYLFLCLQWIHKCIDFGFLLSCCMCYLIMMCTEISFTSACTLWPNQKEKEEESCSSGSCWELITRIADGESWWSNAWRYNRWRTLFLFNTLFMFYLNTLSHLFCSS